MGRLYLCVGEYAQTPYFLEKLYVNVYCVEELCYCLLKNAFLFDQELMDRKLCGWLGRECGLQELEERLEEKLDQGCLLGEFASAILEYAGCADREEIRKTAEILNTGADLNVYEKKKARADYLVKDKKFYPALREYETVLTQLPEGETALRAAVWHNKGVAFAGLFRYGAAADCFLRAAEIKGEESFTLEYLAARRMELGEEEYISFVADHPEYYELSLELEHRVEAAVLEYERSAEYNRLTGLGAFREEGRMPEYYEQIETMTARLKEEYRRAASD